MKHFFQHIRSCIVRGLLAIIPLLLCLLAVELLYSLIDKRVLEFLNHFWEISPIPGLGILLVLVTLYTIGLIISNIIGHQLIRFIDAVGQRIPFINTVYSVGKQLSQGLSLVDGTKETSKKAVLVRLNKDGLMVPAFVMNSMKNNKTGEEFYFVLVPTAPTPGSGFVCVVKASETVDPGWTPEECLKAIVSVGLITPKDKPWVL